MKKCKLDKTIILQQKIKSAAKGILESLARWDYIRQYGCQDPFWPDGVNMNLIRNHVISYKREIEELCQDGNFPEEYYRPTPPEVDNHYMQRKGEYFAVRAERITSCGDKLNLKKIPELDNKKQALF